MGSGRLLHQDSGQQCDTKLHCNIFIIALSCCCCCCRRRVAHRRLSRPTFLPTVLGDSDVQEHMGTAATSCTAAERLACVAAGTASLSRQVQAPGYHINFGDLLSAKAREPGTVWSLKICMMLPLGLDSLI